MQPEIQTLSIDKVALHRLEPAENINTPNSVHHGDCLQLMANINSTFAVVVIGDIRLLN